MECAWGQRIHSFACHAFYCGYRAALRVIDAVGGLESMSMIDHTLLLEYRLGYSEDSRFSDIGNISKKYIVGKIWFTVSPKSKIGFIR